MSARTEGSQLARNALMTYVSRGALVLSAVLLTPYLFRSLGLPGFGTWSVMLTLTTVFTLLEFGVSAGAVRTVAAARAAGDNELVLRTIRAATVVMTFAGAAGAALAVAGAFALTPLAAASEEEGFRRGMLVLAAAMLVRFPSTAYAATLNGYQRYDLSNLSIAVTTILSALGSVVAVEAGGSVFGLAVAHAIALVCGGALYAVLLARLRIPVSIRPGRVSWSDVSRLGRFSSYTLLADSMTFVGQR
ncbi:MAG TPA: hypothetical protein VE444_10850, partial [Gaiellaceae bacterium]|nr:hypothetical protein [Gaiellaceae bacterium]